MRKRKAVITLRRRFGAPGERAFWIGLIAWSTVVGIAVVGERGPLGVAHLTLLPMAVLGITLLASRFAASRVLATLSRRQGEGDPFPALAGQCHIAGYDITGAARFDGPADPRGLPLYPWQRERFWFERTVEGTNPVDPPFDHPLLGFRQPGPVPFWLNHLDPEILPS